MFSSTLRSCFSLCSAVVLFAAAAVGCSSSDGPSGSLGVNLVLLDGSSIDRVDWTITGGDMDPMNGSIDTSAPGSTASVEVFGIPAGDGYTIAMSAESEDGSVTCEGSGNFSISEGETTEVHVM
ncbi:MAG: hypothetical protein AAGF12_42180, partial [Myxococcota bacterium]